DRRADEPPTPAGNRSHRAADPPGSGRRDRSGCTGTPTAAVVAASSPRTRETSAQLVFPDLASRVARQGGDDLELLGNFLPHHAARDHEPGEVLERRFIGCRTCDD